MNIEAIKKKILKKFPVYDEKNIEGVSCDIEEMDKDLRMELENFLETGIAPSIELEGYSIERLKKEFGMNPIGAFLTLDWLKKEPEEAKKSLERGYDEII